MPSPTTIGRRPALTSARTRSIFCSGNASATISSMPRLIATRSATAERSPVMRTWRVNPSARNSASAASASGRNRSANSAQPRKRPPCETPATGPSCAGGGGKSTPSAANKAGRPNADGSPSTVPVTPRPPASRTSAAGGGSTAARNAARLKGWLLAAPSAAATLSAASGSGASIARQRELAGRQRAGLVEHHGVDVAQLFQERGALDQNPVAGGDRDRRDRGRGRRQNQRARARGDQHRERRLGVAGREPCASRGHQDEGQILAGVALEEPRRRRLGALGVAHQRDDAPKRRLMTRRA